MNTARLENYLQKACFAVLAYVPFHAFFSTWVISNFGGELLWKGLKDLIVCAIGVGAVVLYLRRKPTLRSREKILLWVMIGYAALLSIYAALGEDKLAAFAGLILYVRFFLFFGAMFVIARLSREPERFLVTAAKVVTWAFGAVVVFGVLQITLLPNDFLKHFGYSYELIPPFFEVDGNDSVVRILSTLRGPNPLGAYLAVIAPVVAAVLFMRKKRLALVWWAVGSLAYFAVLYRTYSRSAVVGLVAAVGVAVFFLPHKPRKYLLCVGVAAAAITTAIFFVFSESLFVQRVVFHNDPHDANSQNSDDEHASSISENFRESAKAPLGHGLGSAGLASTYGPVPRTVESYYLEVWYQLGIVGLGLFLYIHGLVVHVLMKSRRSPLLVAVLLGLVGVGVINIFWPALTDETVSLTLWGLIGGVVGAATLGNKKKTVTVISDGKTKAKN